MMKFVVLLAFLLSVTAFAPSSRIASKRFVNLSL